MTSRAPAAAVGATLAAAILWGSSFSVNDIGLRHVGPGAFAFLRFAIAGAVAVGALALLRRADTSFLKARWFWGLCAANAIAFILQYGAQTLTTPARTALFVNTSAFTVALLERALFGMRLGWPRIAAIAVGFLGAAILIVGPDARNLLGGQAMGDALAMLSGSVWSLYFVYNDRAVQRENPVHLAAWTFAGTAILLAPAPLLDPWLSVSAHEGLTTTGAAAILYTALFTTALAFGLWTWGLKGIRASVSAVLLLVEILVATLASIALGRESFGWTDLAGAALLVGAILLATIVAARDASAGTTGVPDA